MLRHQKNIREKSFEKNKKIILCDKKEKIKRKKIFFAFVIKIPKTKKKSIKQIKSVCNC
jgi:hypothetical protein